MTTTMGIFLFFIVALTVSAFVVALRGQNSDGTLRRRVAIPALALSTTAMCFVFAVA